MDNEHIKDSLDTIFYCAKYTGDGQSKRFYKPYCDANGNAYYKFENETITLLMALQKKIHLDGEKSIIDDAGIPGFSPFRAMMSESAHMHNTLDFVFVLYIKSQNYEGAFSQLDRRRGITEATNKCLYVLFEIISLEDVIFENKHLDQIHAIINEHDSFIIDFDRYRKKMNARLGSGMPKPKWDGENEYIFRKTSLDVILKAKQILDQLRDVVYKVKKKRLSSLLLEGINTEVNQDQNQVQNLIKSFAFDANLDQILNKINEKLYTARDEFDFKGCIDLIRSFLNELCVSIAKAVGEKSLKKPKVPISKMGNAIDYLRSNDIKYFDEQENDLVTTFNSFLSYKGVHSLKSSKEYARIAKNMAVEIGLFLLERLEKYSIELKIQPL